MENKLKEFKIKSLVDLSWNKKVMERMKLEHPELKMSRIFEDGSKLVNINGDAVLMFQDGRAESISYCEMNDIQINKKEFTLLIPSLDKMGTGTPFIDMGLSA